MVRVWTPEYIHDICAVTSCATVVHVVRNIVHMKQPDHEVAVGTELRVLGLRVAHAGEQAGFMSMICARLLVAQIGTAKKPILALLCGSIAMKTNTKWEVAM